MWPKVAAASALLLLIQGSAVAQDCTYTVSVLDVPGVQCVSAAPCSGTYYASGLSQGVGACPSGSSCALLPETPIMGCAATGRSDLVYVNADGTLTKDGKTVSLADATTTTTATTSTPSSTTTPTTSNTGSKSNSNKSNSYSSSNGSKSTGSSSTANDSNASSGSNANSNADGNASNGFAGTHSGDINPGTVIAGGSDASTASSNSTISSHSNSHSHSHSNSSSSSSSNSSSSSSASNSWSSSDSTSGTIVSPGSSSANQQSFNPGSILSDSSGVIGKASSGGLSLGAVIGIVVGCLAVVAIAAGARLLQKGKEAEAEGELTTPQGAAMEGYNGGEGGGSGMTPKENVLLL